MRALVVSNMRPDERHPERGRFVRDQVDALRRLDELDVELFEFAPGAPALALAALDLRRRFGQVRRSGLARFDVVHAHFGLTAWPALAVGTGVRALTVHGTDVCNRRTRALTALVLPLVDLLATVSTPLVQRLPGRAARARAQVLPCGVDVERFRRLDRARARAELGLDPRQPCLLFPSDPARPEKRHDRALELARALAVPLLTLGGVDPARVPLFVNAANAVLVPSAQEGFGLAVLEALACDVPVLATPVGVHAEALAGTAGTLCAPFDAATWSAALAPHVAALDPRIEGRHAAMRFSAARMAERVAQAWRVASERGG